ncbi:Metallothionein expression activator [Hanseniaspora uvarum DSM 2768]|nr:hypothetical protein FOG50_04030 [Hanseniaspora uvarum]KKA03586.1 Metallothionein expression activator [Hanseniaspora uvarum DSM 2768]
MSFNFENMGNSPNDWNDLQSNHHLINNALIYDSSNEPNLNSNNLLDNIHFDTSKIFNGDVSGIDLPEINDMIDENLGTKNVLFDDDSLLQNLNGDIEYLPNDFFLTKEISSNYLAEKNKINNKATRFVKSNSNLTSITPTKSNSFDFFNKNLVDELKDTVNNNNQFQFQLKENLFFNSKDFKSSEDMLSADKKYMSGNDTSEYTNNNISNYATRDSPSKTKSYQNNKYSILDKYITVSDSDDEVVPQSHTSNREYLDSADKFEEFDSPTRQPQNTNLYYSQGGQSPVANTNYSIQNSPIRKNKTSSGYSHYGKYVSGNQSSNFFDAPKLQFDQNNNENFNMLNQASFRKQLIDSLEYEDDLPTVPFNHNESNSELDNSYSKKQRGYDSDRSKPYINPNQVNSAMIYQNPAQPWNQKPISSQNETMVSISNHNDHAYNRTNQRLKSHSSVTTSGSTILQENSPYQHENFKYNDYNDKNYRNVSHGSSVKKQSLGLGLKMNSLTEERSRALNNALHEGPEFHGNENLNNQYQDYPNGVGSGYNRSAKTNETVVNSGTRKLSKYETPQLQQIPFFANSNNFGLPDINNQANTNNTENSPSLIQNKMFQIVKISSPTQEQPLIGVINRSPKGCRKKTTLPPGSIDQHVAELPDKTFMCLFNNCQRKFPRRYNVRAHVQTHLEDKPYGCELCGSRFVRKHDMIRHSKTHLEKKFECEHCHRKFLTEKLVTDHTEKMKCSVLYPKSKKSSPKKKDSDDELISFEEPIISKEFILENRPKPRKQSIISPVEIKAPLENTFGKISKPVSPKKLQQQNQVKRGKVENALEFNNTMAEKSSVNKVVKKDNYHFSSVNFGNELK